MAGSNGYHNYRHQADIYSIYSILRRRDFPKENIIMLSYDDVVNSPKNPYRGMVVTERSHKNVYPGRQNIDYRGKDASASNFLRVLRNDTTNGPALNSTSEDNVLIYYDDHGAPGMLCVPAHNGPELYGDHIAETIREMKRKKMFKKLLFIIEACYSGSVGFNITEPGVYLLQLQVHNNHRSLHNGMMHSEHSDQTNLHSMFLSISKSTQMIELSI